VTGTPEPGLVVGGRYRLESRLGEGGMAVVWKATHTETDRVVALKLVRSELASDDRSRQMFVREARVAARIGRNEHIIDVLDAGIDENLGVPFLAMELLDGEPLDERLRRDGPLPAELAGQVLEQLADALDQAHAASVVHRDLKPQNLFLTRTKKGAVAVKVLDFGIAKIAESTTLGSTQVGTPAYAAPEQLGPTWRAMGEKNGKRIADTVSPATDVWAFGIVAYELYTGARSGEFWNAATVAEVPLKMVLEPVPTASERAGANAARLPAGFDAWLARCLELDAERRWPNAGEAVRALLGSQPGAPQTAAPPTAAMAATAPLGAPPVHVSQPPTGHASPTPAGHASQTPPVHPSQAPAGFGTTPQFHTGGDPQVYRAWQHFHLVPPIAAVNREARTEVRGSPVLVGEIVTGDDLMRAMGSSQFLLALVTCPRFQYRAAVRSRQAASFGDSLSRGLKALDSLVSVQTETPPMTIGDPWFESRFEIRAESPQEALHALPTQLRQLLLQRGMTGVLETRSGGFVVAKLDLPRFEAGGLQHMLSVVDQLLGVAGA